LPSQLVRPRVSSPASRRLTGNLSLSNLVSCTDFSSSSLNGAAELTSGPHRYDEALRLIRGNKATSNDCPRRPAAPHLIV
jgi:hypothetical protein